MARKVEFSKKNKPCHHFAMGKCQQMDGCRVGEHHPNLDPGLVRTRTNDYDVSCDEFVSCQACLNRGLPCDKKGRAAAGNDPCSQCRHHAGDGADPCVLSKTSLNDVLWQQMMVRYAYGHTLPEPKPRDHKSKGPMSSVCENWRGLTAEQLVDEPSTVLPDYVFVQPRAHLRPPTETQRVAKHDAFRTRVGDEQYQAQRAMQEGSQKRKRESEGEMQLDPTSIAQPLPAPSTPSPALQRPFSVTISRPLPHPDLGRVISTTINWDTGDLTHSHDIGSARAPERTEARPMKKQRSLPAANPRPSAVAMPRASIQPTAATTQPTAPPEIVMHNSESTDVVAADAPQPKVVESAPPIEKLRFEEDQDVIDYSDSDNA